jgi:hypothetical protein
MLLAEVAVCHDEGKLRVEAGITCAIGRQAQYVVDVDIDIRSS